MISHGLASHSGVFDGFTQRMTGNGIAVYRFDARGHGKSDGRDSIHINSYFEMVEDLRRVVEKAKAENPNLPVFVMGHSMGGYITALRHQVSKRCGRCDFGSRRIALQSNELRLPAAPGARRQFCERL
nr:alpha/beta fold hydrolase [Neisseria weixii]